MTNSTVVYGNFLFSRRVNTAPFGTPLPGSSSVPVRMGSMCPLTHEQIRCIPPVLQECFLTEISYFWLGSSCAGNQGEFEEVHIRVYFVHHFSRTKWVAVYGPWLKQRIRLQPAFVLLILHGSFLGGWGFFFFPFFSLNCISKFLLSHLGKYNVSQIIVRRRKLEFSCFQLPMSISCCAITEAVIRKIALLNAELWYVGRKLSDISVHGKLLYSCTSRRDCIFLAERPVSCS